MNKHLVISHSFLGETVLAQFECSYIQCKFDYLEHMQNIENEMKLDKYDKKVVISSAHVHIDVCVRGKDAPHPTHSFMTADQYCQPSR